MALLCSNMGYATQSDKKFNIFNEELCKVCDESDKLKEINPGYQNISAKQLIMHVMDENEDTENPEYLLKLKQARDAVCNRNDSHWGKKLSDHDMYEILKKSTGMGEKGRYVTALLLNNMSNSFIFKNRFVPHSRYGSEIASRLFYRNHCVDDREYDHATMKNILDFFIDNGILSSVAPSKTEGWALNRNFMCDGNGIKHENCAYLKTKTKEII